MSVYDLLNSYHELEDELIMLTGFNVRTLVDKLEAGYTIEPPEDDKCTLHLVDIAGVDDNFAVYMMGPGVEWDDLTKYEKRLIYESQKYLLNKKRR